MKLADGQTVVFVEYLREFHIYPAFPEPEDRVEVKAPGGKKTREEVTQIVQQEAESQRLLARQWPGDSWYMFDIRRA